MVWIRCGVGLVLVAAMSMGSRSMETSETTESDFQNLISALANIDCAPVDMQVMMPLSVVPSSDAASALATLMWADPLHSLIQYSSTAQWARLARILQQHVREEAHHDHV